MHRTTAPLLAAGLIALGAAPAHAAKRSCEAAAPATARLAWADPFSQVTIERRSRTENALVGCLRSTRRRTVVAGEHDDPHAQTGAGVQALLGGRFLWTVESHTAAESFDSETHRLTDLRTGKRIEVGANGDSLSDVTATAGALVRADQRELSVRRLGGGRSVLDTGPVAAPGASASTLYWRRGTEVRSAPAPVASVAAPAVPAARRPAARRTACLPRGHALVARAGRVVVSRDPDRVLVGCRIGTGEQWLVAGGAGDTGPPRIVDEDRHVAFVRTDPLVGGQTTSALVLLDLATGRDVVRVPAEGLREWMATDRAIAWADSSSLRIADATGVRTVARGEVSELAAADSSILDTGRLLYWTVGGAPGSVPFQAPTPAPPTAAT